MLQLALKFQASQGSQRLQHFVMIEIRIYDLRSLRSWCIKGTEESTLGKDSSVPLMHHDPSDLGSLILIGIIPKERTLNKECKKLNWNFQRVGGGGGGVLRK